MSYDLTARSDENYSIKVDRQEVHELIKGLADIETNGDTGFVLKQGDKVYMEIDIELVSEEGDNIEDRENPAPEVNCINFHIPYGFINGAKVCIPVAAQIRDKLAWQLYDLQEDKVINGDVMKKPWWKFW